MKPARLSSGLLARKGGAAPLAGAYGGTGLEPLIGLFGRGGVPARPQRWPAGAEPPAVAVQPAAAAAVQHPSPAPVRPATALGRPAPARATTAPGRPATARTTAAPDRSAPVQAPHVGGPTAARRNAPVRLSLHLDPESHARLRILAARKGARPQALLREALDSVLAAGADECPCVRGEVPCCGKGSC